MDHLATATTAQALIAVWIGFAVLSVIIGTMSLASSFGREGDNARTDRIMGARFIVLAPVWPLVLAAGLVAGAVWLVRTALTKVEA